MTSLDKDIILIAKAFKDVKGSEKVLEKVIKSIKSKEINTIYISHWKKIKFYYDNV